MDEKDNIINAIKQGEQRIATLNLEIAQRKAVIASMEVQVKEAELGILMMNAKLETKLEVAK